MIPVLVESALRALLVAFTVWGGLRLFRVSNVPAQKAAWGLVLFCAVAMPLVMRWQVLPASMAFTMPATLWGIAIDSLPVRDALLLSSHAEGMVVAPQAKLVPAPASELSAGDRFPPPDVSTNAFHSVRRIQPAISTREARPEKAQVSTNLELDKHAGRTAPMRFLTPGMLAGFLCLAVSAVLLLRMAVGLCMAVRLWAASERFEPEPGPDPARDPGAGMRLRFSFAVSSPVTIGSGVLLPADCLGWDREKLCIVLGHERAHVRQGDFYLQLLAGIYAAVFWFSPLGWWLKSKLSDLGEAISDRAGLEEATSRTSYAQVLLEFAALPRPTVIGVAMARSRNISHRMERFLNESTFRQAFAGSRRTLLAVLLVPVALFVGTGLIRVEAAQSAPAVQPPSPAATPDAAPGPAAVPSTPGQIAEPVPPLPPAPTAAAAPAPAAPQFGEIHDAADDRSATVNDDQDNAVTNSNTNSNGKHVSTSVGRGFCSSGADGDSWALVTDASKHLNFNCGWNDGASGAPENVRRLTNGKFLWFTRNGKSYFLDDPAIMGQVEAMYKPMEELGRQQEVLGKQQEELGRQQEALGRRQEQASVPAPDISKEMAKLNEAVAKLNAKKGSTVSQEDLADIQGRIGDIQGRLGELQGEMGSKQGELGEQQGKLGEQQGKLGEEQGKLGEQQGKLAEEANRKVKAIIDESLRNGKARPVE